jgi:hypothetical protein
LLSPLQSLGFNHTLKVRKEKKKRKKKKKEVTRHLKPIGSFFRHQITTK